MSQIDAILDNCKLKTTRMAGYTTALLNNTDLDISTELGKQVCEDGYSICLLYRVHEEEVIFTIFSEDVNVSFIAEKYGNCEGNENEATFNMELGEGLNFLYGLYLN